MSELDNSGLFEEKKPVKCPSPDYTGEIMLIGIFILIVLFAGDPDLMDGIIDWLRGR